MVLRITRWLLGYVRFSVLGGSPERFYSSCARAGAYLWDIAGRRNGGACVAVRSYRSLRPCAHRAGCRLRVRERRGLPFLLRRTRGHGGLWAGAAAFAAVLYLLSLRVWCVQAVGNVSVPTEQILAGLSSAGLSPGVPKKDVDPELLAQKLMLRFPQIRWMSVNTQGCVAQAVIQEKVAKPEVVDRTGVCNIKAAATGQILSMKVYAGTPLVSKGDAVVEGQLLVSAVVENEAGGSLLTHAQAEILAETSRTVSVAVELNRRRWDPTGRVVVRRNFDLYGARFPLTLRVRPRGNYRLSLEKTDFQFFGNILPAWVYTERWEEVRPVDYTLTKRQAVEEARREADRRTKELLKNGRVVSSRPSEQWEKETLNYTVELVCEENIAEQSEIFIK